jgi:thiosulfate dehydrogenase
MMNENDTTGKLIAIVNKLLIIIVILAIGIVAITFEFYNQKDLSASKENKKDSVIIVAKKDAIDYWQPKDISLIKDPVLKSQVEYGKELLAHTSKYLGPNGSVSKMTNGLNCQNCHLQAGTIIFGNNYGSVNSMYPKFRARSGSIENLYKRINDCIQRSLNGTAIDTSGKEMQAIAAYINYIGSNVEKGKKAAGSGFKDLSYLDRAANPGKGMLVYESKCQSCHQQNGEGLFNGDKSEYIYPALWGANSFNDAAGLYRISNFAKYVKYNMPQGTTYKNPLLTDEEAWDVAAFVNSQKRPHLDVPADWPDKSKKPVDHPFGPYADKFSESQHKFGPFKPIADEQKKKEDLAKEKKSVTTIK